MRVKLLKCLLVAIQSKFEYLFRETNLFVSQTADGVIGLSPKEKRFSGFMNHLLNNAVIKQNVFSLCLGQNGGVFSLGGIDSTLHDREQKVQFLNYKVDELYKLELESLFVGDVRISAKVPAGLDTGTTNTYFPKEIFESFYVKLKEICSSPNFCFGDILKLNDEICFYKKKGISKENFFNSMPKFTFNFKENVSYTWQPESYLYEKDDEFCLSVHKWEYFTNNFIDSKK